MFLSQSSAPLQILAGITKLFVGDVVEEGTQQRSLFFSSLCRFLSHTIKYYPRHIAACKIMAEQGEDPGPLRPIHLREVTARTQVFVKPPLRHLMHFLSNHRPCVHSLVPLLGLPARCGCRKSSRYVTSVRLLRECVCVCVCVCVCLSVCLHSSIIVCCCWLRLSLNIT
jgi:hypothetical protein